MHEILLQKWEVQSLKGKLASNKVAKAKEWGFFIFRKPVNLTNYTVLANPCVYKVNPCLIFDKYMLSVYLITVSDVNHGIKQVIKY